MCNFFSIQVPGMNPIHTPTFVNSMLRIPGLEGAAACQHYLTIAVRNWELCGLRVFSFGTFDLRPSEIIGPSTYVPSKSCLYGEKKIEKKFVLWQAERSVLPKTK